MQAAIPSIEQLISTGHSAPDALFAVLIGPVRYFILNFVLAVRHRPDHACLLVRPDRLLHRAGRDRTVQMVRRRLDRAGGRRDPARAERLGPGERPPAVDPGRPYQRCLVPRLREGRIPRRPGGSRRLAASPQAARHAGRARTRSARRTAQRNAGRASARDPGRAARTGRPARRPAGQTVVGALTADPVPLLTVHLLGTEDQAAAYPGHRCHNGRVSDRRGPPPPRLCPRPLRLAPLRRLTTRRVLRLDPSSQLEKVPGIDRRRRQAMSGSGATGTTISRLSRRC